MNKKKILLIDDEKEFTDMITMRLRAEGFEVLSSVDGAAGLEKARRERPDLVIADIVMPRVDGHTICRAIKKEAALSAIPVILLSGQDHRTPDGMKEAALADAYFDKPVDDGALVAKIRELLKKGATP